MKTVLKRLLALCRISLLLPALTIAITAGAQGAKSAISFPATSANEHVNLGTSLSSALATSNFTLEMWVNFNAFNADEPIIANKDWNNGANIGWALTRSSKQSATNVNIPAPIPANTLWFNMTPTSGTRRDWHITLPNLNMIGNWVHVVIAVDRKGSIAFYFNGVPATIAAYAQSGSNSWAPITTVIAADSNKSMAGTYPVRLGQDGTGTYSPRFSGKVDEVRIWNTVRTITDIRDNMCHRLTGSESGLLAYYKLDETSGTTALNSTSGTGSTYNGTLTNSPLRIASAAPVGDTSLNVYGTSLSALTLTTPNRGSFKVQNAGASLKGLHVYRVDTVNSISGITAPGADTFAYGVFPVDTAVAASPATYDVQYDFTSFANAVTYTSSIDLYRRFSLDSAWTSAGASKNTTTHIFNLTGVTRRKEFILGNFSTPGVCNMPAALNASAITTNSATLSWTSGGSSKWNVEYGVGSFTLGTGTRLTNLSATTLPLTGLQPNTTYKFYVQDSCVSLLNSSAWAGPFTFTTLKDYSAFGSGYAVNFPGTGANEHINLDTTMSNALATSNFSFETWINFTQFNGDESFVGNKNWNSGANIGFIWGRSNKTGMPPSSLWFNFTPSGGTRRDWHVTIPGLSLIKSWNHVAVTVDRKGDVSFYINGIRANILQHYVGNTLQTNANTNIAADSGKSIRGTLPVRLAQDGTGTYGVKFNGKMDEVRFWNTVRTQQQIRDYMCRKLPVNTAGLITYFRFDEPGGTTANNLATATSGSYNGVLTNGPQRVPSGAAIGDTSTYLYAANLAGSSLSLASPAAGGVTVDSLKPSYSAVQLYRLDTIPNTTFDIASIGTNKTYFGVFPVDTGVAGNSVFTVPNASYRLRYDYAAYPAAVATSSNLHLYNRSAGDVLLWTDLGAVNTTATNRLTASSLRNRREVILADFNALPCGNVSNIRTDSLNPAFVKLGWTSTGTKWNVQYGLQGFTLGSGTTDTVLSTPKDSLGNLQPDTWYDVYVRNRCTTDSSKWVGPYSFKTLDRCPAPQMLQSQHLGGDSVRITWNNTGAAVYNLQWGQQGFAFGTGVPINNVTGTSYVLSGLSNTQTYDIYIQDTCSGGGMSKWFGPLSFQATGYVAPPTTGVVNVSGNAAFRIFPNPAQTAVQIDRSDKRSGDAMLMRLTDMQGRIAAIAQITGFPYTLDVSMLPAGIYMLQLSGGATQMSTKLTITK